MMVTGRDRDGEPYQEQEVGSVHVDIPRCWHTFVPTDPGLGGEMAWSFEEPTSSSSGPLLYLSPQLEVLAMGYAGDEGEEGVVNPLSFPSAYYRLVCHPLSS